MRFATVRDASGQVCAAVSWGDEWYRLPASDLSAYLRDHGHQAVTDVQGDVLERPELLLPLPSPAKVVCCGLNYAEHIAELGRQLPEYPTLFAKHADTLIGPTEDVSVPIDQDVDWEAELAVVIGRDLRDSSRNEAASGIFGYAVANDVSVRTWQNRTPQWFQGKAWDRTTPLGPLVVSADELDPSAGVEVITRVDGVERQRGSTSSLVFDAADLVAYISTFTLLRPGDLVLTGTPGGVGMGMTPPVFLRAGSVLETEIPGIGVLRNRITSRDSRS